MASSTEESALVERLRRGDQSAMAEYLERRRPQLLAFIQRNLSDALRRKVDPEDLVQEVHVDCLRALHDVEFGQHDPFRWVCQVAERRIIDAHRHYFGAQKRDAAREVPLGSPGNASGQAGLIGLLVASITSPSQAFSRDQREIRLLDALRKLPQQNQDALRMRYVENLPSKEIAQRLNKSDVAVRVMLSRSLDKLQSLLATES